MNTRQLPPAYSHRPTGPGGFSLLEVIATLGVVMLLMLILLSITRQTSDVLTATAGKIEQFRDAREGFDSISRRLSQATLNTYWDYDDPAQPTRYVRQSELRFLSGEMSVIAGSPTAGKQWVSHGIFFQAPIGLGEAPRGNAGEPDPRGLNNLLNTWGYFIEFGDDLDTRPPIITPEISPARYRFRLCEYMQAANNVSIYRYTSGQDASNRPRNLSYKGRDWFTADLNSATRPVHVIAENVIALVIRPKLSAQDDPTGLRLAPEYQYDSTAAVADPEINPKNQLPPVLEVTMVALDEASARRLENGASMPDLGVEGLFGTSSGGAANFAADLETLERRLSELRLNYRVFTTSVSIKGAKWSREQAN